MKAPRSRKASALWRFGAVGCALSLVLLGAMYQASTYVHPDIGWLVYVAERANHGAVLYRDLIEVNPPLVIWLYQPIAFISNSLALPVEFAFSAAVSVLAVGSIVTSCLLLDSGKRWPALPILALVYFALPGRDFGQREHLLLLLIGPFLCLAAARAVGSTVATRLSILVGLAAAVGFAFKPQFGGIWIGTAVYLAARMGWKRFLALPESMTLFAAAPLYILAVTLLTPEYWRLLWTLGELYGQFVPRPLWALVLQPASSGALLAVALWLLARGRATDKPLGDALAIACLGAVLGIAAQGKGFPNHFLPATMLGLTLTLIIIPVGRPIALSALVLLTIFAQQAYRDLRVGWFDLRVDESPPARLRALIEPMIRPGDPVVFLMWRLRDSWPIALEMPITWTYSMPSLWWVRAAHRSKRNEPGRPALHQVAEMSAAERFLFDRTVKDLLAVPPRVLIMPRGSGDNDGRSGPAPDIDVTEYFGQEPKFAALLRQYELKEEYGRWGVWRSRE